MPLVPFFPFFFFFFLSVSLTNYYRAPGTGTVTQGCLPGCLPTWITTAGLCVRHIVACLELEMCESIDFNSVSGTCSRIYLCNCGISRGTLHTAVRFALHFTFRLHWLHTRAPCVLDIRVPRLLDGDIGLRSISSIYSLLDDDR